MVAFVHLLFGQPVALYRWLFWVVGLFHLAFSAWLCLTPELAKVQLQDFNVPLIYLQEHGLFLFMQACAYFYVAERPQKSMPVAALAGLINVCLPLFTLMANLRGDIGPMHFRAQIALSAGMLAFLGSYALWYYRVPRPDSFMPLLGIFGDRK